MSMEPRQFAAIMDNTARIRITCSGVEGSHKPGKTIGMFGWCPPVTPLNDGRVIGQWLGRGSGVAYRRPEAEFDEPGESRQVYHETWKLHCKQCARGGHPQTISLRGLNRRKPNVWSTADILFGAISEAGRTEVTLQEIAAYLSTLSANENRVVRYSPMPGSEDGMVRVSDDGTIPSWASWQWYGFAN
ncbi:hypothetical protein [Kocuria marina]|uniref:hypothetical protein n=1 Tax=Kocuria marina TaxID=223184 RepID=UPI0034609D16